jgi:arginase
MGAGPEHLLAAGLAGELSQAGFDAGVSVVEMPTGSWTAEVHSAFHLARDVAALVRGAIDAGAFPLILAGNCGPAALGAVAAIGDGPRVFWFDAHGDFNTPETTGSGFLDGMALAVLTGRCWTRLSATIPGFAPVAESSAVLIGARDLDPLEIVQLEQSRVRRVEAGDVRRGLAGFLATTQPAGPAYVHIDLDVLDPVHGRANSYAAPDGLSVANLEWAVDAVGETMSIAAAAFTAYDPDADENGTIADIARRLAVSVVRSASRIA